MIWSRGRLRIRVLLVEGFRKPSIAGRLGGACAGGVSDEEGSQVGDAASRPWALFKIHPCILKPPPGSLLRPSHRLHLGGVGKRKEEEEEEEKDEIAPSAPMPGNEDTEKNPLSMNATDLKGAVAHS